MIRPCIKALQKADVTNIRVNSEGMLSMQHVIPSGTEGLTNWVEFRICSHEEAEAAAEILAAAATAAAA
jgi:hypothetical protein